ncbi:MAG TPA: phosphoglycerate dehydrogenase [Burkholderiaceae bacterium]|nr:phosphoglycerate dehydrogenase [Burkholderiaceae bacterium]
MEPFRILTFNQIAAAGLARFDAGPYRVGPDEARPDAILLRSHELRVDAIAACVKAIARAGAGTNNIPVAEMSRRGVPVFNAPGANANAVKELVLAGLLLAARNLVPALGFVAALPRDAVDYEKRVEGGKKQFAGVELARRTLGVIGLGAIGSLVADAAIKLGMDVVGYDPELTVDAAWRLPATLRKAVSVEDVLRQADFVTLHVPLLEATRGLVGERRLKLMRAGAVLLNFSRDGIVDEGAARAALQDGRLKAYVCDFPSPALAATAGAVALPHLGASTDEAEENCAVMVADRLRDFLENGTVHHAVNFPDVEMPRGAPDRLAIANANVPNMLGQISTALARSGLNIHDMVNKSRGEIAYTLVDVDSAVNDAVLRALGAIDGVLSVRLLPRPDELAPDPGS